MTEQDYCCKAIIVRFGRRCYNRPSSEGYCIYHGPLCYALTLDGLPCNSMVLKFREGFIYCSKHENVSIERYVGQHQPTKRNHLTTIENSAAPTSKTREPKVGQVPPILTVETTTTTTTTTITTTTTTSTQELGDLFERLGLMKKSPQS